MNSAELYSELTTSANEFSSQLKEAAEALNGDVSKIIRASILRVYANIIKRSPVDTGAYRASHGIANFDPGDTVGIKKNINAKKDKDGKCINPLSKEKVAWSWKLGDGNIWLYNNLPYAERLEQGWSSQAPLGIYMMALMEIGAYLQLDVMAIKDINPFDIEG